MIKYKFKNKPYAHQAAYLTRFWKDPVAAVFADMGTGKTFMIINNIAMLYDNGYVSGALVIAPKGVYQNWVSNEIPKHIPEHVDYKTALWSPSPKRKAKQDLESMFELDDKLHILIMNVEAFSTQKGIKFAEKFLLAHDAFMVIDESTTIKSPKAKRTKNIYKLGKLAKYKRICTGSPVTKSPLDLYTQCAFLNVDLLGFPSYYAFRARYAILQTQSVGPQAFNQVVGYRRLDELSEKLKPFAFRIKKEECLDLPEKVYSLRYVDLTDEQEEAYKSMKKLALAMLEDGSITTTASALTQILRLHQICCGHIKTDDGKLIEIKSNRMNVLMDCIEESSGKVIIWANYTYDIEAIVKKLSEKFGGGCAAGFYGATSNEDRVRIVENFQDPKSDLLFFVGQPRTGGYGLTLTQASNVIYYSNSYDLEVRLQSEDRAHRIGQTKSVNYIDLISQFPYVPGEKVMDTIDQRIVEALKDKIDIASKVLGEELKKWLI